MTKRFKNLAAATVTAGAALIAAPAALADTTPAADAAADAVPTTPWLALLETSSQAWGQILDVFFGIVDGILGVMADTGFHL